MHKTENGLVCPSDDSSEDITAVTHCLQNAGFSEADLEWLVDLFKRPDCFGDPNGTSVFREDFTDLFEQLFPLIVERIAEAVQIDKDRQTRLALLFSCMLGLGIVGGYPVWFLPNVELKESDNASDVPAWVHEFQKHAKFSVQNLHLTQLKELTHFEELLLFLFPEGIPLLQIVDLELLNPIRRQSLSSNDFRKNPNELEYWLIWRFRANAQRCEKVRLDTLLPVFSDFSDGGLGNKVLGLLNAIDHGMTIGSWNSASGERLDPLNDGWRVVTEELIPFLELLNSRKPDLNQERSPLLKAWWRLSKLIYSWSMGGLELGGKLPDEFRDRLVESASRHIGILRSVLRDTPEVFENEEVRDFYDKAFYVLLCFAPPWKCLKPLLLAFTEMTKPAVAKDLRTWAEIDSTDNPPSTYSRVPKWIEVAMYPQNLKSELDEDPYLQNLREEFAKFCLERLRTKVKNKASDYNNADFVEPRPAWRRCYVQALAALRVNPGGRGHRTLFWLLNNDPDETVKEFAKKAHKRVRHLDRGKPNLDEGASPRRPLFEAFWWLRQAHLITFGVEIDQAGAMRTRRRELHRTREKDDRYERKR